MRYLGIDYGLKKIGLAISEGEVASPLKIVEVGSLKDALVKIEKVIDEENIDKVIIGMPEGKSAGKVRGFVNKLGKNISVEVADETLTSKNASKLMIALGVGKKNRRFEDAYSAALILQNYLESAVK